MGNGSISVSYLSRVKLTALVALLVPVAMGGGGCSIQYYDAETGTAHLWGFGHMKMKVGPENEGVQAVVYGTETAGVSVGTTPSQSYLSLGWQRMSQLEVVEANTAVRLEWPSSDFFTVRVGTEFPHAAPAPAAAGELSPKDPCKKEQEQ